MFSPRYSVCGFRQPLIKQTTKGCPFFLFRHPVLFVLLLVILTEIFLACFIGLRFFITIAVAITFTTISQFIFF